MDSDFIETAKRKVNFSSGQPTALFHTLKEIFQEYMDLDPKTTFMGLYISYLDSIMVLGPYVGPPTVHDMIPITRGVVGKCVETGEMLNVGNVKSCEYYLSCCIKVKAEIVLPIKGEKDEIVAVLDLDSSEVNAYKTEDEIVLRNLADILVEPTVKLANALQLKPEW